MSIQEQIEKIILEHDIEVDMPSTLAHSIADRLVVDEEKIKEIIVTKKFHSGLVAREVSKLLKEREVDIIKVKEE